MSAEIHRLLQAVEQFKSRTRGADLPEGTEKALSGLTKTLSTSSTKRNSPGERAAQQAAPGNSAAAFDAAVEKAAAKLTATEK